MGIRGLLFCAALVVQSGLCAHAGAQEDPRYVEVLDQELARAHARKLIPIAADDVIDGRRGLLRALPPGVVVGAYYHFRLAPVRVRFTPVCEMLEITFRFDFEGRPAMPVSLQDLDLLELRRSGSVGEVEITTQSSFASIPRDPRPSGAGADECPSPALDLAWHLGSDAHRFQRELAFLEELRSALDQRPRKVKLTCVRDRIAGCPLSAQTVMEIIGRKRRQFETMRLSDRTELAEFTYYDELAPGGSGETVSVQLKVAAGVLTDITVAYEQTYRPVF